MAVLLIAAALADSLTFLVMGTANEANPIVRAAPLLSLALKAALVVVVLGLPLGRYARPVRATGAVAWSIGALSNAFVLLS